MQRRRDIAGTRVVETLKEHLISIFYLIFNR